jgi:RNA polymerase sigma-70 factor (ECF subfamily)
VTSGEDGASAEALQTWVVQAVAGEAAACSSLYRALHPAVARFVARRVAAPRDREDLVAQTFHRMLEALGRYDPAKCSVRGWVLTIARNLVIDHLRAMQRGRFAPSVELLADALPGPEHARPDHGVAARELERRLSTALGRLPLRTRQVIALRIGDGLSHAEIAEVLDLSIVNVKQIASRGLRQLREDLAVADEAVVAPKEVDLATG